MERSEPALAVANDRRKLVGEDPRETPVALAVGGLMLLTVWKAAPWVVDMLLAAAGTLLAATHYS